MKKLFIHAKVNKKVVILKNVIEKLPARVGLVTTIQFLYQLQDIKKQLEKEGKEVHIAGQVLGCRADLAERIKDKVDAFLYIGSGQFHPIKVALVTKKQVFQLHPDSSKLVKLDKSVIEKYEKKRKASYAKFLTAKKVGVLVSTKVGQNDNKINKYSKQLKMKGAGELLERKDKEYYLFAFNTLNELDLENFPFVECWVNTACSRIADEKVNIINIDDIREFEKE
ncbi:diphthamide synthesis protein [Nanoarchaeota archaeon]